MKLNRFILAPLVLAVALSITACGSSKNTQPEIAGVSDKSVEAGSEFKAMEGVTASDKEDGDITNKVVIESSPALDFKNGVAVPDKAGTYEITYSVTDKGGLTTESYSTLTVTRQTNEAVLYKEFDFSAEQKVDNKGWEAHIADGASATAETKQGAYVFDIQSPGNVDGDIMLSKTGFALKAANNYKIKVWAKSTANTYAHIIARDESTEEWSTFGGTFNAVIGTEISPLELNFTSPANGSAEIMINLGKITPNPDNPSDTTPENFTVTIDKIEIYEISGQETVTPVYTTDFSSADETAVTVSAGDGAEAAVNLSNEVAAINITSYPTEGGIWSVKGDIALPGIVIENGKKYSYSFKATAKNAQSGECLVESSSLADKNRVNFNGFSLNANEETTISGTFTAEFAVEDPVIRLQIGNPSEGVTSNSIIIDDVQFCEVSGDLETKKTIDSFAEFGRGTANEANTDLPWETFNGSDEDSEGVGTVWAENGSLFYRIDKGGVTDWHNKLICGYNGNPLVLEADSYYTIEITAKATKNVSCGFFLNTLGNWDPRISQNMDITTEEQTFTFETTDTFITDMNFEMLFQFGSENTAQLGDVTIEFSSVKIFQKTVN